MPETRQPEPEPVESESPERPRRARRSFGPTVLVGLVAGVLAAVAAGRGWAGATGTGGGVKVSASVTGSTSAPLAVALALVALAAWGVVLVLRGRVRRWVAVLGVLASAGVLVTVLTSAGRARADAVSAVVAKGATDDASSASLGAWFVVCAVAAAVTLAAFAVAVVAAPGWPAMGSRFDAPASSQGAGTASTEQDMWRALDDGHDPTT
jgi:uncharacterized membrane protein (TIGR02234 family)